MPDWLYHTLRFLHPFGMFLAFAAAPIVLGSTKGVTSLAENHLARHLALTDSPFAQ